MQPFQPETKSLYQVGVQAESSVQHTMNLESNPALRLDGGLHSAGEVASARNFFAPGAESQALSSHAAVPGLEHSAAAALKAASQTISPLLQLIMRLPTHISIFSSFFEAIKSFFLPHTDVLTQLAHIHATGLNSFGNGLSSLGTNHAADWSIMPTHAHIFQTMAFDPGNMATAHLHLSPAAALRHSMNVSAGADLQNPQFEKMAGSQAPEAAVSSASNMVAPGDTLAGPGISAQAITPHLAPAERIFTSKYFEMPTGSQMNSASNMLASSQNVVSSNTVAGNNVIASASIAPSPSLSQAPAVNSGLDTAPLEGLHAKELSFANFSGSHHSAHSIASSDHHISDHSISNHPIAKQAAPQAKASAAHPMANKYSSHNATTDGLSSTPAPAAVSQSAPANTVYTVKSGDTLWRIAHEQLGDGSRWQDIYNLNTDTLGSNPDLIHSGTAINLPQVDQNTLPDASQDSSIMANQSLPENYTVKPGDDLWQISQNLFGGGQHWPELYSANTNVIGANPDMILPGQKFDLPGAMTGSHIANAIPAHSAGVHAASSLHHVMPKAAPHIEQAQSTLAANINPPHVQTHMPATHASHVESAHPALASNSHVASENTFAHIAHPQTQISMHTNINSNNGLSIESAHDQMLSGAGSAQASGAGQNSVISKAANNLVAGKSKSVVSFSLTPDLSFLEIPK